jgi:hypothetical protein
MNHRSGTKYQIVKGEGKGKYCLALPSDQREDYLKRGKLFVRLYDDQGLQHRTVVEDKKVCALIHLEKVKYCGMQD